VPEFIPITAGGHFKCAFDVSAAKVPKIMTHMRQTFRAWSVNRIGENAPVLHRAWFYVGNNPKVEPAHYVINEYQLRTVSAPSADRDEPTCWAFEMIHPDADERARRWSAEIILRKNEDGSVRFTSVVKNWMVANYIGEYPSPPTASALSWFSLNWKTRPFELAGKEKDTRRTKVIVQVVNTESTGSSSPV